MRGDMYQIALIFLGVVTTAFFGVFVYREIFPEYRIYQNDFIALEKFRASYKGGEPAPFKSEVKQIVLEREDKGPPVIDRCMSCHVALQIQDYSPTKIAHDINGNPLLDAEGVPVKVPNENYVWAKLEQKITELTDPQVNEQLKSEGNVFKVKSRLAEADYLKSLETADVSDHVYDVKKVLAMHPLIGRETRPFENHPLEEYGCTSCHGGNGKGLTTDKAHGPVFDGEYETEFEGPTPEFTERDLKNDPQFASVFNNKPGDALIFQTSPILVGDLIQAKCVQCHQSSSAVLQNAANSANVITDRRTRLSKAIKQGLVNEEQALITTWKLKQLIAKVGYGKAINSLKEKQLDYTLPSSELEHLSSQEKYLTQLAGGSKSQDDKAVTAQVLKQLNGLIVAMVGSDTLANALQGQLEANDGVSTVDKFLVEHQSNPDAKGSLFVKAAAVNLELELMRHVQDTESSFEKTLTDQKVISAMQSDVDKLLKTYHRGQELYISQACYACHRIAGFARGGVGPELTREGKSYPWFIKESIVWPQADLKTSTMPNFRLDHEELEPLVTFLLAQQGENNAVSDTAYKLAIQQWEAGKKQPWEEPVTPAQMHDLRYGMTVFATEGCSACHRLEGYDSNVGYRVEKEIKDKADFGTLYKERQWFQGLIPEMIVGSRLVSVLEKNGDEIDRRIVDNVRSGGLLEEIEAKHPETIESLYTPFRYAARAKDAYYDDLAAKESDPVKKQVILQEHKKWKDRVHRVLLMFVQEYGLGRLVGPRPNWSGVYRPDEWLMEHFHNPSAHVARSIMPVLPFDDTKFWALTYMLDLLGKRNRDAIREIWKHNGFSPELAYKIYCLQCHGEFLQGNGPVSEWIYPISKNLRNAEFLRNLTKERVIESITHGIKGTPMPPWGEIAQDKATADEIPVLNPEQIGLLADWLFSALPGGNVIKASTEVPKWHYTPEDVIKDLHAEGNDLKPNEKSTDSKVSDYFDEKAAPVPGPDKNEYYIKKEYYTPYNISQGKEFFELNCATCHGAEADGSGLRAEAMKEAKPRMLTNFDWINTRDDLRLIRSIKYGVNGTAMTPWGDFTSSLQRMQLVIFIRTLTDDRRLREALMSALYKTFDVSEYVVEQARVKIYPALAKLQQEYDTVEMKLGSLYNKVQEGQAAPKEAVELYQQQLDLMGKLRTQQEIDNVLKALKSTIANEGSIYQSIGLNMITVANDHDGDFEKLLKIISLLQGRFTIGEKGFDFKQNDSLENEIAALGVQIVDHVTGLITALEKEKIVLEGRIKTPELDQQLHENSARTKAYNQLKIKVISGLQEAIRIRQQEKKEYDDYLRRHSR